MAADLSEKKEELEKHLSAAYQAIWKNDYLSAYQNFTSAGDIAKDLSEMSPKPQSGEYASFSEEYYDKAKMYASMGHLSYEDEGKYRPRKPAKGFDEFVGLDSVKDYLRKDIVEPWKERSMYSRPLSALFVYGPSGTAKTTLIQSLIHELGATGYFVEPMKNITSPLGLKEELGYLFSRAEDRDRVVIYFDDPEFFFPKEGDKKTAKLTKTCEKLVRKEIKRIRKEHLDILFVASSDAPYKLDPGVFSSGLFDDLIRLHRPDHVTRKAMIEERLSEVSVTPEQIDKLVSLTRGYVNKELSRLCRALVREAKFVTKESKPALTDDIVEKVLKDFVPADSEEYDRSVESFEKSLPSDVRITDSAK